MPENSAPSVGEDTSALEAIVSQNEESMYAALGTMHVYSFHRPLRPALTRCPSRNHSSLSRDENTTPPQAVAPTEQRIPGLGLLSLPVAGPSPATTTDGGDPSNAAAQTTSSLQPRVSVNADSIDLEPAAAADQDLAFAKNLYDCEESDDDDDNKSDGSCVCEVGDLDDEDRRSDEEEAEGSFFGPFECGEDQVRRTNDFFPREFKATSPQTPPAQNSYAAELSGLIALDGNEDDVMEQDQERSQGTASSFSSTGSDILRYYADAWRYGDWRPDFIESHLMTMRTAHLYTTKAQCTEKLPAVFMKPKHPAHAARGAIYRGKSSPLKHSESA